MAGFTWIVGCLTEISIIQQIAAIALLGVIVGPDHSLPFVSLTLRSNTDREHRRVIGYWYLSEDRPTIDPVYVKIHESLNLLASEKSILSLIAVSTATDVYGPNPQATLESFLSAFCAIEPATGREPTRPPVCGG